MSTVNGVTTCNGCELPIPGDGVATAVVVSDLDFLAGRVVNLHFCRAPKGKDGRALTCADRLLKDAVGIEDYPRTREAAQKLADVAVAAEQETRPSPAPEFPATPAEVVKREGANRRRRSKPIPQPDPVEVLAAQAQE